MLRIHADHSHHAFAVDDLALVAHLFDGCSNLHNLVLVPQPALHHGRVKTHGPLSVTATQCSKCAEYDPSFVTAVHLSGFTFISGRPRFTIGSIARTMPSRKRGFSFRRST